MSPQSPLFSVVIPTHNNLGVLRQCLAHWRENAPAVPTEILVIEDGCTDGTVELLREQSQTDWGRATLRWFHENDVHELRCDNRGFREARGQYLLAWQDDMFLQAGCFLPELERTLKRHAEMGLIALSRGLLLHHVDRPITAWEELLAWERVESTIGPAFWNWFCLVEVDAVCRPWVVRKECLDKVGLLDEAFVPCEWDESDLCFRIRQAGWRIAAHGYERLGAYRHLGSSTIGKMPSDKHKAIALRNGLTFHQRWSREVKEGDGRKRKGWLRSMNFRNVISLGLALGRRIAGARP